MKINNITSLEDRQGKEIWDEIKKFESKSNKTENIFKKSLKIFSNKPESKVQLFILIKIKLINRLNMGVNYLIFY
jgi:hypothetical protein